MSAETGECTISVAPSNSEKSSSIGSASSSMGGVPPDRLVSDRQPVRAMSMDARNRSDRYTGAPPQGKAR